MVTHKEIWKRYFQKGYKNATKNTVPTMPQAKLVTNLIARVIITRASLQNSLPCLGLFCYIHCFWIGGGA